MKQLFFSHFINHLTLDLVFEDSAVVVVNVAADVEVSAVVVVDLAVVVADAHVKVVLLCCCCS